MQELIVKTAIERSRATAAAAANAVASQPSRLSPEEIDAHVQKLRHFFEGANGRTVVLTGAGISTDSGIPDYRGPNGVYIRNKDFKPIQYQQVAEWMKRSLYQDGGDVASSVNPDGDVDITWDYDQFEYPSCDRCGGFVKPKVVFFGENMPTSVRDKSFDWVDDASALLVVGSSLQVFSAMRLLNRARNRGIPVGILNLGPTRGDDKCDLRVDATSTDVLTALVDRMRL
ncbi:hypothetical protein P43SY_011294 [Pythium insidiosum]|uniref:Deacetylase sirtuin-type domain-containing protein n=1 Tax=Pythium insidiosum TaxID=114742 RepID=A0AAD5L8Q5_PYTIN|nr:hypothetical protein P43SY_011294 [Pythium insidiosum]